MKISLAVLSVLIFFLVACEQEANNYYPKPRGYMRLDFPDRVYTVFEAEGCPYQFEIPAYFAMKDKDDCKKDIEMERFNAALYLTYLPIDSNLMDNTEYARKLVYEHSVKADAIDELPLINSEKRIFGLKYDIKGNAASPYQFYVTDSTNHFLRGALYFNVKPNYDSIKTSLNYIKEDLDRMLETIAWK